MPTNFTDWSLQANTTIAAGAPPQNGSASVGGGVGWRDFGNYTLNSGAGLCTHNVVSGVLSNTRTNNPGSISEFPANGLIRQASENFADGEAWVFVNAGSSFGVIGRFDATTKAGLGISYQSGTLYIEGRNEAGSAFLFDTTAVNETVPSAHALRLRVVNISSTSLSILAEIHAPTVDTANPGTPIFRKILTQSVSDSNRAALRGSGAWGVGNIGGGEATKFYSYAAPVGLTAGQASATIVAKTAVKFTYTAAAGATGSKTYSLLRNGVEVSADIGATGSYIDTGLTPNRSYTYTVRVTDSANAVADYTPFTVTTLNSNARVIGIIGDSNLDAAFGIPAAQKAPYLFRDWLISLDVQCVVINEAIAGTTAAQWASTGLGLTGAAITNSFTPLGVTDVFGQLGTNDAKTSGQRTDTQYDTDTGNIQASVLAISTAPRMFWATPPTIPANASGWNSTGTTRISEYRAKLIARCASSPTDRVFLLDSKFYPDSITNAAAWNLDDDDVHYNSAGHTAQALLWRDGWQAADMQYLTVTGTNTFTLTAGTLAAGFATEDGVYIWPSVPASTSDNGLIAYRWDEDISGTWTEVSGATSPFLNLSGYSGDGIFRRAAISRGSTALSNTITLEPIASGGTTPETVEIPVPANEWIKVLDSGRIGQFGMNRPTMLWWQGTTAPPAFTSGVHSVAPVSVLSATETFGGYWVRSVDGNARLTVSRLVS